MIDPNAYKDGEYLFGQFDKKEWVNSLHDLKWFLICGAVFTAVLLTYYDHLKYMWMDAVLLISFVLPQVVLYSHAGMSERYILPSAIGYAFFFVIAGLGNKIIKGYRKYIYIGAMALLVAFHIRAAVMEADYFRYRGNGFQATFDLAADIAKQNPDAKLCATFDYFETNKTLEFYLMLFSNDNMYYCHNINSDDMYVDRKYDRDYSLSGDNGIYTDTEMDVYFSYSPYDRHYTKEFVVDPDKYERILYGTVYIDVRKDSGIVIPDPGIRPTRFYQL